MTIKTYFNITYFAKKHKGFVTRSGKLDDKTKKWTDKKGNQCFTYYDLDNMGYRTPDRDWETLVSLLLT